MRTVYEAKNFPEASLLRDLLLQQDIDAHLLDVNLQSVLGEVPFAGVRVQVAEDNFQAARQIALAFDTNSKAAAKAESIGDSALLEDYDDGKTEPVHRSLVGFWKAVGLALLVSAMIVLAAAFGVRY